MRCPHCGKNDDRVIESRERTDGESIRRRRECNLCSYRFTSYERIEEKPLLVVKRDGRREPFDRSKLDRGIGRALEKRPVSQSAIEEVVNEVEDEAALKGRSAHEIASRDLGDMILRRLYRIDRVAYIRFASVYRHFENVNEFIQEIERLSSTDGIAAVETGRPAVDERSAGNR